MILDEQGQTRLVSAYQMKRFIDMKFTQQERRGLSHVTVYYFESLKINDDGNTKSYNTSVPFDVYTKVEVGQKFIYGENGEMQQYNEG